MNTIIFSAVGIISLLGVSYLFSYLGEAQTKKAGDRLAAFRKKLTASGKMLTGGKLSEVTPSFSRTGSSRLRIFPANGDRPVL